MVCLVRKLMGIAGKFAGQDKQWQSGSFRRVPAGGGAGYGRAVPRLSGIELCGGSQAVSARR